MSELKRRLLTGLAGVALLVVALLVQSAASILIGLVGAALLLSAMPYGSTSMRGRSRRLR